MQLAYVLKCSPFFNSVDNDFLDAGTPENESENVKQVMYMHVRTYIVCLCIQLAVNVCFKNVIICSFAFGILGVMMIKFKFLV